MKNYIIYQCEWCDKIWIEDEIEKFGVHECCPNCRSIDLKIHEEPNLENYGLDDVKYFQACKDFEYLYLNRNSHEIY